jgi:hypothetical protein
MQWAQTTCCIVRLRCVVFFLFGLLLLLTSIYKIDCVHPFSPTYNHIHHHLGLDASHSRCWRRDSGMFFNPFLSFSTILTFIYKIDGAHPFSATYHHFHHHPPPTTQASTRHTPLSPQNSKWLHQQFTTYRLSHNEDEDEESNEDEHVEEDEDEREEDQRTRGGARARACGENGP